MDISFKDDVTVIIGGSFMPLPLRKERKGGIWWGGGGGGGVGRLSPLKDLLADF